MTDSIDKKKIQSLLPHREPMLLVDRLINIVPNGAIQSEVKEPHPADALKIP